MWDLSLRLVYLLHHIVVCLCTAGPNLIFALFIYFFRKKRIQSRSETGQLKRIWTGLLKTKGLQVICTTRWCWRWWWLFHHKNRYSWNISFSGSLLSWHCLQPVWREQSKDRIWDGSLCAEEQSWKEFLYGWVWWCYLLFMLFFFCLLAVVYCFIRDPWQFVCL